jgi:Pseudouridylate synthases, 23S RNA-specific
MRELSCTKKIRLSRLLMNEIEGISYAYAMELIKNKDVKINGKRVSEDMTLSGEESVFVYADEKRLYTPEIRLIKDLGAIAVFFKPRGVISEVFAGRVQREFGADLRLSHRLDTNTEGLLIFSRGPKNFNLLKDAFKNGYIKKKYLAEVAGRVEKKAVLKAYLTKNPERGTVEISDSPESGGVQIITEIDPVGHTEADTTLLEVGLPTGKTHQIRAHLAHIGHPVIGDPKYGDYKLNNSLSVKKQRLSAVEIGFDFPENNPLAFLNREKITAGADFI